MDVQGENQPLREMFSQLMDIHDYYKSTLEFFSKDILDLLVDCSTQSSETVAKISINSMRFLIDKWHESFTPREWETVIAAFRHIFERSLPKQLMTFKIAQYVEKVSNSSQKDCLNLKVTN